MDLHFGTPLWKPQDADVPSYPELRGDIRSDLVVVGAGVTGALCAHALAEEGMDVVVVDARSIGMGSTCASTAMLQYELDVPLHKLTTLVGEPDAVRSYQLCAEAMATLEGIALKVGADGFKTRRSLQFASRRAHVEGLPKEQRMRTAHGLSCSFFDERNDVHKALGFDAPAVLLTPVAAEMDAFRFTHALHTWNAKNGVRLYQDTAVVDVRDTGSSVHLRTPNGATIQARDLIYATGYETRDGLPRDILQLHSTYAIASKADTDDHPWPGRSLIWETARPYRYLRTAPQGRIIIGGRDMPFRNPKLRDALLPSKAKTLENDIRKLYPHLSFQREHAWCDTFGTSKDGLPYIDKGPTDRRSYYALGLGGNGIVFGAVAAGIIRDRILGRPNKDNGIFRFDR